MQFSTLPELYNKNGIDFYVSNRNVYRNNEIKKLVWDLNPYVKGETDEDPNIGTDTIEDIIKDNFIERIEESHGFKNTGNKYPIIYYKPKNIEKLNNKTILSLYAMSVKYDNELVKRKISEMIDNSEDVLVLEYSRQIGDNHVQYFNGSNIYFINDIFDHCDVIASCKRYITLLSGASVLASAIIGKTNKKNTEVILVGDFIDKVLNLKYFYFDNLIYTY